MSINITWNLYSYLRWNKSQKYFAVCTYNWISFSYLWKNAVLLQSVIIIIELFPNISSIQNSLFILRSLEFFLKPFLTFLLTKGSKRISSIYFERIFRYFIVCTFFHRLARTKFLPNYFHSSNCRAGKIRKNQLK